MVDVRSSSEEGSDLGIGQQVSQVSFADNDLASDESEASYSCSDA
jgi:hypothetical protein